MQERPQRMMGFRLLRRYQEAAEAIASLLRCGSTSLGMKRLMNSKFKIPKRKLPIHPKEKRRRILLLDNKRLRGRKRPLQPGEMERRYYRNINVRNEPTGRGGGGQKTAVMLVHIT